VKEKMESVRTLIKNSFWGICALIVRDNLQAWWRFRFGDIETDSGMTHAGKSLDSSLRYIEEVYADYKRYSGVSRFYGRIAEVGPGDNCGVALMFLADGCESVELVDRFYSKRSSGQNADIYRALISRHPQLAARLGAADASDEASFKGLFRRYGESASAENFFVQSTGYDSIVSRAVLEHVYDPKNAIRRMATALNPGGMLLHKVDFRDHDMFSKCFHELKFLEVPDWLYPRMTRNNGLPNRVLVHEYRLVLRDVLPDHKILVTRLAAVGDIDPHLPYECISDSLKKKSLAFVRSVRQRFARSMLSVSDEDLSVAGIFVIARKGGRAVAS
jgi:SAM-dependent methyltransferase